MSTGPKKLHIVLSGCSVLSGWSVFLLLSMNAYDHTNCLNEICLVRILEAVGAIVLLLLVLVDFIIIYIIIVFFFQERTRRLFDVYITTVCPGLHALKALCQCFEGVACLYINKTSITDKSGSTLCVRICTLCQFFFFLSFFCSGGEGGAYFVSDVKPCVS